MSLLRKLSYFWDYLIHSPLKIDALIRLGYRAQLRSAWSLRRSGRASALPPLMTIEINKICNLRCVQCWEWGENGAYLDQEVALGKTDELDTEAWLRFIDQAAAWKPYVYFSGGEPFLRKDLVQMIERLTSRGLLSAVNSNATLITPALAEKIVRARLDYFVASLDGPQAVNDAIRRGDNVFEKVIQGIQSLVEAKRRLGIPFPVIEVVMTLTSENQSQLVKTAELVDTLGVDFFRIQFGAFTNSELFRATRERFEKEFRRTPRLIAGYIRDVSSMDCDSLARQEAEIRSRNWTFEYKRFPKEEVLDFDYRDYFHSPARVFGEKVCHVPWKRAEILSNGDVAGCRRFPEAVSGNITRAGFSEIWNGTGMKTFRGSLEDHGLFASCSRCVELYSLDESDRRKRRRP